MVLLIILALLIANVYIAVKAGRQWLIAQAAVLDVALLAVAVRPITAYFAHMEIDLRIVLLPLLCAAAGLTALVLTLRNKDTRGFGRKLFWHYVIVAGLCAFLFMLVAYGDFDLIGF